MAPSIQADIARALQQADSRQRFVELLGQKRIGVVFREKEQGRIYGVTFIDHDRREVFNRLTHGQGIFRKRVQRLFQVAGRHL